MHAEISPYRTSLYSTVIITGVVVSLLRDEVDGTLVQLLNQSITVVLRR